MNKFLKIFIFLILAAASVFIFYEQSYHRDLIKTPSNDSSDILFKIELRETAKKIAQKLADDKIIVSKNSFIRYLKSKDLDDDLQAGRYILSRNLTIPELTEKLIGGKTEQIRVRLPEGFTIAQMDNYLSERFIVESRDLINCASECDFSDLEIVGFEDSNTKQKLEGYLFPDTYFHDARSVTAEKIIRRALVEMQRKLDKIGVGDNEIHEILTMASMIEKETWTEEEKSMVSGILWGRLSDGMRLDIDATTRYSVNKLSEPLTRDDLNINDPYNTRKARGMPPGPIGASSEASLRAVVNPDQTSYRYYLHDKNGIIHYARILSDHNINIAKWLR